MKKPYYNLEQRQYIYLNTSIGAFMQFRLACLNFCRELERTAKRSKFLLFIFSVMAHDCVEFPSTLAKELSVISPYTVDEIDKIVKYAKIANNIDDDKNIVIRQHCMQAIKIAQEEAICLNEAIVLAVHAP